MKINLWMDWLLVFDRVYNPTFNTKQSDSLTLQAVTEKNPHRKTLKFQGYWIILHGVSFHEIICFESGAKIMFQSLEFNRRGRRFDDRTTHPSQPIHGAACGQSLESRSPSNAVMFWTKLRKQGSCWEPDLIELSSKRAWSELYGM
jgi:hypothetical protein